MEAKESTKSLRRLLGRNSFLLKKEKSDSEHVSDSQNKGGAVFFGGDPLSC